MRPIGSAACLRALRSPGPGTFALALVVSAMLATTGATSLQAQRASSWGAQAADSLVSRAIARRGLQLADSSLLSYRADARGFLAFLAQLGEGGIIPPKLVQSEELALSIAWWQPGRSAQQLVGRRDTTLLPASVSYYRDRYGVVLDNLPERIRLGDGQDVRDVPHPLSASAAEIYEYARGDAVRIRIPGREIVVDEVKFRPRDASNAAAVGSVFLDQETAAVVRLSMTFTRAAILDRRIETLVLTLENSLVGAKYWLPRRQEVEVSRGSTWLDIPARGIVRGRWEIGNYTLNERIPPTVLTLPRWSAVSRDSLKRYAFADRIVDVLPPDIQVASSDDVVRARVQAEAAVRASMLSRPARATASARGVSDLVRYTRTEGVALGVGAAHRTPFGVLLSGRVRYGFADEGLKGQISVGKAPGFGRVPLLQLFAEREYRDLAPAERAGVTNSLAALAFGSEYTTQVDTRAFGVIARRHPMSRFSLRVAYERDEPTRLTASSLSGQFDRALPAWSLRGARAEVRGAHAWLPGETGALSGRWTLVASSGAYRGRDSAGVPVTPVVAQAYGSLQLQRGVGGDRAVVFTTSAGVSGGRDLPPQWLLFVGGPWSAPGYAFHQFSTRGYLSQRLEARVPVPAPSVAVGRIGRSPAHVTLAPFVQVTATAAGAAALPTASALWPSAGVGALFFYDVLRADVSRGLRDGRWRFSIDIDRGFWGIL